MNTLTRSTAAASTLLVSSLASANGLIVDTTVSSEPGIATVLALGLACLFASRRMVASNA